MSQPTRLHADPATLAAILRPRATRRDADPADRAYVQHWDTCQQCQAAHDAEGMCPTGRHLYCKQAYGGAKR